MSEAGGPYHFIGIGGIGMAALAEWLHAEGEDVRGSDRTDSPTFERLRKLGVDARIGHEPAFVGDARTVVVSSAIRDDNPELAEARARGLRIVGRGALLAERLGEGPTVAIGGSHGKTTTTALSGHLLVAGGLDPTVVVGGRVPREDGDAGPLRLGAGAWRVAEVDESDGSFLRVRARIAVVTNVDPEHLDHYGDRAALDDAFVRFANAVPEEGACVLGVDHPGVAALAPRFSARTIGFGFDPSADVRAEAVAPGPRGQRVDARLASGERVAFDLPLPGRHNVLNALAAIAVAEAVGVPADVMREAIPFFPGVSRRYERKGEAAGVLVVDDYAHHPAEIRAALAGARSLHDGRITAIFQPHRYTRTRDCWDAFTTAFADADRVVLCDVYAASEPPIDGIDAARLAEAVRAAGHPDCVHGGDLDAIAAAWPERFEAGELVLTLGAGDVVGLGPRLLAALDARDRGTGGTP